MIKGVSQQDKQILNIIQLCLYAILSLLSIFKSIYSYRTSQTFLLRFYITITLVTFIEILIQSLQIAYNSDELQVKITDFLIVNLYAMLMQSLAIFLLSDYWYETRELLTKNSSEMELKQEKHIVRYVIMGLWTIAYSAFITYGLVTQSFVKNTYKQILVLGCQGISAAIILYALFLQLYHGHTLKSSINKYKEWMNTISISLLQFKCLYYISTILNVLRIGYLIAITIIVDIYQSEEEWLYVFGYVYTATNIIVIGVYLGGFRMRDGEDLSNQTLLSTNKDSLGLSGTNNNRQRGSYENDNLKRRQTQLSRSSSSYQNSSL